MKKHHSTNYNYINLSAATMRQDISKRHNLSLLITLMFVTNWLSCKIWKRQTI